MLPSTTQVSPTLVASFAVAIIFNLGYPIVLAIIANRRLKVSWRYFGFGALIFFVFQIITRVPAVLVLQSMFAHQLQKSAVFQFSWSVILVITAGLFEETGRYLGYRFLMRNEAKTWNKAVMYGIGHGGLESMLLVGGLQILTLVNISSLKNVQPSWLPLLSAWERLWTVPVHIALAVIVLQVFRRKNIGWLWLAILAHAMADFIPPLVGQMLGSGLNVPLITEGVIMVFGLVALWVIWRLREREHSEISGEQSVTLAVSDSPPVA